MSRKSAVVAPGSRETLKKMMCPSEPRVKKTPQSQIEKTERSAATAMASTNKSNISFTNIPALNEEISKTLNYHQWYHGMMPRDEIEDLLKKDGDFLVRKTDVANKARYAISVYYNKRIRHILLNYDGMWWIRTAKKKTLIELIEHLVATKYAVQTDNAILVTAVPRPDYYILHEHIELGKKLGGGAFGDVHCGIWKKGYGEGVEVAIKKLKGMMHKKERCEFVKEARIMRKFNHPNLVQLIGVAPNETPLMIVLELCPGGSLQSHLKKHMDLKQDKLTAYCIDACRGMCYLSVRKVIHRGKKICVDYISLLEIVY
uniref:Tyrosine-protein kinase n=1 Tax=Panagrolaimus superbus TaxID=310955 RepID=A0A914YUR0_9BILA